MALFIQCMINEERLNGIIDEVVDEVVLANAEREVAMELRKFCDRVLLRRYGITPVRGALRKLASDYDEVSKKNPFGGMDL